MSGAWLLVVIFGPLLPVVFAIMGFFVPPYGPFVMLVIGLIIGMILIGLMFYNLIERRNEHFKRSRTLREGILKLLEKHEGKSGISSRLANLRSIHSDLNSTEDSKSAGLYAILSIIIPFLALYVMYFLTSDIRDHDKKERMFFRTFAEMADELGVTLVYPEWKEVPDRSAGLYVILTLIIPLFALYWLWTLLKDPHKHFAAHRTLEDHLSSAIS